MDTPKKDHSAAIERHSSGMLRTKRVSSVNRGEIMDEEACPTPAPRAQRKTVMKQLVRAISASAQGLGWRPRHKG